MENTGIDRAKISHLEMLSQQIDQAKQNHLIIKGLIALFTVGALWFVVGASMYPYAVPLFIGSLLGCVIHAWHAQELAGMETLYHHVRRLPESAIDFSMDYYKFIPKRRLPLMLTMPDSLVYLGVFGAMVICAVVFLAR